MFYGLTKCHLHFQHHWIYVNSNNCYQCNRDTVEYPDSLEQYFCLIQVTQKTLRSVSREQSGSTYIRWGKKTCPNITTTSQVYSGQAAGGHYQHTGSAEYICLPIDPEYDTPEVEDKEQQGRSLICGAEYETNSGTLFGTLHDRDVPCSLCYTRGKTTVMLPARTSCYSGWTLEYRGFLMSSEANQPGKNYVCVDKDPEEIDGSNENKNGALLYLVEAREGSFGKKPYKPGWELSCAVCSTTF